MSKFYLKPAIVITIMNVLFFYYIGSFLESYEGAMSSFIHGTYTKPCSSFIDINNHFLIMVIYEYISKYFPDIQVYGVTMYIYNWISITFLGLVLYRILKVNAVNNNKLIFILLYVIISIDNILNLSSTRISFTIIAVIYGFIESNRFEGKKINQFNWILICFLILFSSLMRPEAILLSSIVYIAVLLIFKRFYIRSLISLVLSMLLFLTFNIIIENYSSEAKQVFIFKEKEILDRNNFKTEGLTEITKLDLLAFIQYGITDKEHFTLAFYDKISKSTSKTAMARLKGVITNGGYLNTLKHTFQESFSSWCFVLFYLISGFFVINQKKENKYNYVRYLSFILLLPLGICFSTVVPLRFMVPLYSLTGCVNVLLYIKHAKTDNRLSVFCTVILFFILINIVHKRKQYIQSDITFKETIKKLELITKKSNSDKPVIINIIDYEKYFPVNPLQEIHRQNALFLNFFYHSAYDFYIQSWTDKCHCNSFSIKEKVDYVVSSGNLFLINDYSFEFMKIYFEKKYQLHLVKYDIGDFDKELKICKLSYTK